MTLANNIAEVKRKIQQAELSAGRSAGSVKLIAVSKYSDNDTTRQLVALGCHDLAENRADKFLVKVETLSDCEVTWHYIGNLQTRKVRDVIDKVAVFHALDSLKLAQEIEKRASHVVYCFLEVNVSGEESKHGIVPDKVIEVARQCSALTKICIIGLMTMAPIDAEESQLTEIFSQTAALQRNLAALQLPNVPCSELSMGMSRDYEIAIRCGATMVRIGSDLVK